MCKKNAQICIIYEKHHLFDPVLVKNKHSITEVLYTIKTLLFFWTECSPPFLNITIASISNLKNGLCIQYTVPGVRFGGADGMELDGATLGEFDGLGKGSSSQT